MYRYTARNLSSQSFLLPFHTFPPTSLSQISFDQYEESVVIFVSSRGTIYVFDPHGNIVSRLQVRSTRFKLWWTGILCCFVWADAEAFAAVCTVCMFLLVCAVASVPRDILRRSGTYVQPPVTHFTSKILYVWFNSNVVLLVVNDPCIALDDADIDDDVQLNSLEYIS